MTSSSNSNTFAMSQWDNIPGWAGQSYPTLVGDFDGDGKSDMLVYANNVGAFYVATSTGTGFNHQQWLSVPGWAGQDLTITVGDFNGDGKSDLLIYVKSTGQFYVATSTGSGFNLQQWLSVPGWAGQNYQIAVGDFNGDGKSDVLIYCYNSGTFYVATSNGSSFSLSQWLSVPGWAGYNFPIAVGDFNGDGKSDVLIDVYTSGQYYVATSIGSSLNLSQWLSVPGWAGQNYQMAVGDFNGDGKSDVLIYAYNVGAFYVATSTGMGFNLQQWLSVPGWGQGEYFPISVGDFNGDGKSDVLIDVYTSGQFYVATSTGSSLNFSKWMSVPDGQGCIFR